MRMLNHGKQRVSQLYRCRSLLTSQDLCLMYKSWIRPTLEYGNILYSGAALSHPQHLDNLQAQIERTNCSTFQPLLHCRNTASLNLSVVSLLGRDEGTCKASAQCSMELLIPVTGLAIFVPGILQAIYASLTHVISEHLIDSGTVGRFQLFISGTLFLQIYF